MSAIEPYSTTARAWLARAIPLWADQGRDRKGGGFFEELDFAGRGRAELNKRLRVQARQIYVMSHAHVLGLKNGTLRAAEAGFRFMTAYGWSEDGGFVHLLSPDGICVDATRDTYDHAFVLLALAWYLRATGDPAAREWIERTLMFLNGTLWDEVTGSFHEAKPDRLPRRQNPHMHMLEAFLALFEATEDERFLARARSLVRLLERRFFVTRTGTLGEFFTESWAPAEGLEGLLREPGHHFEWVWLLTEYERLTGEPTGAWRGPLFAFAAGPGTEPETGLVYDGVNEDGTVQSASKRCWVQTEALKASLVENDEPRTVQILKNLFARYLATTMPGLWVDQLTGDNAPGSTTVPASTLYHVFVALVAATQREGK